METGNINNNWPEIVFGSTDSKLSQRIRRALAQGELRKLASRIYTSNLTDAPETIIKRHCYFILNQLFPNAVISHRSALEGGLSPSGLIILTYKYTKKITLPGITVRLIEGPGPLENDTSFMDKLFISSRPRALLENLQSSKGKNSKTLPPDRIEHILDNICRVYNEQELNFIREQAKIIAKQLDLTVEYKKLSQLISTILGTHDGALITAEARARSEGMPFDNYRNELFAHLFMALNQQLFEGSESFTTTQSILMNTAFFESYFSNFIEGTEFTVEEAEAIIFQQKIIPSRPEDAHDILSTYNIVASRHEMLKVPHTFNELIELLQHRHHILMAARPDKTPGIFKEIENRAGDTVFVKPDLVKGTLLKGFEYYEKLEPGFKRAVFMMFLISEVHPFLDGNGRIARIMMNAELEVATQTRIIIPTVYREDYLLALRALSRDQQTSGYIKMLSRAQSFTASIDFTELESARKQLNKCDAFKEPYAGKLTF